LSTALRGITTYDGDVWRLTLELRAPVAPASCTVAAGKGGDEEGRRFAGVGI